MKPSITFCLLMISICWEMPIFASYRDNPMKYNEC